MLSASLNKTFPSFLLYLQDISVISAGYLDENGDGSRYGGVKREPTDFKSDSTDITLLGLVTSAGYFDKNKKTAFFIIHAPLTNYNSWTSFISSPSSAVITRD